jgi:hypothetical protein
LADTGTLWIFSFRRRFPYRTYVVTDAAGTARSPRFFANDSPGTYLMEAGFTPVGSVYPGASATIQLTNIPRVQRQLTVAATNGMGEMVLKVAKSSTSACEVASLAAIRKEQAEGVPASLAFPLGLLRYSLRNCRRVGRSHSRSSTPVAFRGVDRLVSSPTWRRVPTTRSVEGTTQFVLTDRGDGDSTLRRTEPSRE